MNFLGSGRRGSCGLSHLRADVSHAEARCNGALTARLAIANGSGNASGGRVARVAHHVSGLHVERVTAQLVSWRIASKRHFPELSSSETQHQFIRKEILGRKRGCERHGFPCYVSVVASAAIVVFNRCQLQPGEERACDVILALPDAFKPSYSGKIIQIKSKLSVEMTLKSDEAEKSATRTFWFPIKILPARVREIFHRPLAGGEEHESHDSSETDMSRANPFLPYPSLDFRFERRSLGSPRENGNSAIRICGPDGCEILKLSMLRTDARPGDELVGILDFRDATSATRCARYSVSLVAVETVPDALQTDAPEERVVHANVAEITVGLLVTSFQVHVPAEVTPAFSTDIFSLKWLLHFELSLSSPESVLDLKKGKSCWKAPSKIFVANKQWELPVSIVD